MYVSSFPAGDVRLFKGNGNSLGIVQIYQDSTWKVVCGHSFSEKAAEVTCWQLGFERGTTLPLGAFGEFTEQDIVPYKEIFQECSTGQERRLLDCTFNAVWSCSEYTIAYASIVCSSGTKPTTPGNSLILSFFWGGGQGGYNNFFTL